MSHLCEMVKTKGCASSDVWRIWTVSFNSKKVTCG